MKIIFIFQGQERQEDAQLRAWREQKEQKEAEIKKETQEDRSVLYYLSVAPAWLLLNQPRS